MCIICVDMAKGKLTTKEARRALGEMAVTLDPVHLREVRKKLSEAESEEEKKP